MAPSFSFLLSPLSLSLSFSFLVFLSFFFLPPFLSTLLFYFLCDWLSFVSRTNLLRATQACPVKRNARSFSCCTCSCVRLHFAFNVFRPMRHVYTYVCACTSLPHVRLIYIHIYIYIYRYSIHKKVGARVAPLRGFQRCQLRRAIVCARMHLHTVISLPPPRLKSSRNQKFGRRIRYRGVFGHVRLPSDETGTGFDSSSSRFSRQILVISIRSSFQTRTNSKMKIKKGLFIRALRFSE